ncbi:MAG: acyl-CoA carboxylase subunit epsilon [Rhodoglobus sp.]
MNEHVATSLRFVTPASPEEIAAVTAVIQGAVDELADAAVAPPLVSAWSRSQRPIRGNVVPGAGIWRGYSS